MVPTSPGKQSRTQSLEKEEEQQQVQQRSKKTSCGKQAPATMGQDCYWASMVVKVDFNICLYKLRTYVDRQRHKLNQCAQSIANSEYFSAMGKLTSAVLVSSKYRAEWGIDCWY